MPSGFKRLAADHAALYDSELPPNYLFPSDDGADDLTQLTTLLAGPQGTPYSQGLWRLHLKMPEDYPKSPPKASFKTRIWHPNVEESTGAVCVDTLKRDWKPTLTLKDVLITISCLLIYPNPDSALNSTAGAMLQEDYGAFSRQAKLMTSIHALVPAELKTAVMEAKLRGEDAGTVIQEQEESRSLRSHKGKRVQSVTMKKNTRNNKNQHDDASTHQPPQPEDQMDEQQEQDMASSDDENENPGGGAKENDPSLSPLPVKLAPPSPRKNAHGKRPLSVLTMPVDSDYTTMEVDDNDVDGMTASEKNIAANCSHEDRDPSPLRKSPKLSVLDKGINAHPGRPRDEVKIFEDIPDLHRRTSGDGKENRGAFTGPRDMAIATKKSNPNYPPTILAPSTSATAPSGSKMAKKPVFGSRKVSSGSTKPKARIGIRRL
ncbi:hypothetical protein ASPWEDRAFT_155192 [Aspergillus wentii DTO 134E9]|uniref:UBC core domain-containing protein n=1 Tax=Aspergillus wentii DTO 134E9 TaxID=1073089 RepID=A0A1L9RKG7_ASPWE|nr:uncharacterized protein ASPWEDRAFT_155192 [Aspergillus wentii DTO 134E9]KAI9924807.1 ubiquitin-conjugating enzyme E2 S [Aspergillus wentii]OJJ35422.1 hypothetical protein ASPWEDRAFT_155192 [Aspergillus wentii DTO 134E9]